jgi:hypothetical protein
VSSGRGNNKWQLADNNTVLRHIFACYLKPTTRCRAKIDTASCRLEKRILFVQLDEFECRTGSVALLSEAQVSSNGRRMPETGRTLQVYSICRDDFFQFCFLVPWLSESGDFPIRKRAAGEYKYRAPPR